MTGRLASILVAALALAGATAAHGALLTDESGTVSALAQPVLSMDPGSVPEGMVVVFVSPDGFSDGGDPPEGYEWVLARSLPDGFSDGGDVPEGFVAAMAEAAGQEFWRTGMAPEGLVPVLAWLPPDGFSDGGDLPEGFIAAFLRSGEDSSEHHTQGG